jgi:hypothetical protein
MSDAPARPHPPEFIALCRHAAELLDSVPGLPLTERGERLRQAHAAVEQIDRRLKELDLDRGDPHFSEEQGDLIAVASALQALELDRGGPNVRRYVDRAITAIRHVAGEGG